MRSRKANMTAVRLGHIVLPVAIAAFSLFLLWHVNGKRNSTPPQLSQGVIVTGSEGEGPRSECDTLRAGTSLHASLLRKDISVEQITSLLEELGNVMDLKKCMPGESYELVTDGRGSLKTLRYVKAPGEILVVEPAEDGLTVFQENVPLTKIVRKVEGIVDLCLYDAVCASGGDAELAMMMSDIFAWDIDFFTEPRSGDKFSLLVEQYMRGDYPKGYGNILAARYDGKETARDAYFFFLSSGKSSYFTSKGTSLRRAFLRSPLNYRRISSFFTNRRLHPILKRYRAHHGIDYAAAYGTPVVAIGDGVVEYAGWKGGYGRFVSIKHNSTYVSNYGHLSRFGSGIRRGARVTQGGVIGYVGSSGLSTGPHLDFRIQRNGSFINPLRLEIPAQASVPEGDIQAFKKHVAQLVGALNGMSPSSGMEFPEFEQRFFPDTVPANVALGSRF